MQLVQVYWWSFCTQWNIPNALSATRVVLGVTIPLWWQGSVELILIIILWAGISDGLDGWWARKFHKSTTIGQVFDPIADKCFINPFLACLAVSTGSVWVWLLFAGNLLYDTDNTYRRRYDIDQAFRGTLQKVSRPVTWLSKWKTASLFLFMVAATVGLQYPAVPVGWLAAGCLFLVLLSWRKNRS